MEFFHGLFLIDFMPHRYCLRLPQLIWIDAWSDGIVALSYFLIPVALIRLIKRREDLAFPWLFLLFATFILSCGATHVFGIVTLWIPAYRFEAALKVITALASLPTAILLIRAVPRIAELPGAEEWSLANKALKEQIREREVAESNMRALNATLEEKVEERTYELREKNAKLQELTAAWELSHGLIRSMDGIVKFWCGGSEQLYGWTKQQALGRISHELLQTYFPQPLAEIEAELLERGSWQGELAHQTAWGTRVHVASSWVLRRNGNSNPDSVIEVNNDITDRLKASEASALLAAIVESSDDAIIGKSLEGKITSWNSGAERLFGYRKPEIIGQPVEWLIPAQSVSEEAGILAKIRRGERVDHFETIRLTKTGQRLSVSLTISPIRNAAGFIVGASTIARDMTARQKMEENLRRTNHALEEFAYAAAHDLQEPLRNVALSLQLVKAADQPSRNAETTELVDLAIRNSQRMGAMVKDLLAFSRALDPGDNLPMSADAGNTFQIVLKNLEAVIEETKATISCSPLPWVGIPEIHLLQIFQNIIGNALKYHGAAPPQICVGARRQDDGWLFAISDKGIGIAREFHERIFGIFKRLDKEATSGSGVGLALCKRIVEHYGGKIWLESNADRGVTFFFSVPPIARTQHENGRP